MDGRPVEPSALQRMAGVMDHRGPDGTTIWFRGSVGLGQQILLTTPQARPEILPSPGPEDRIVLVSDVRIDNRDELLSRLGIERPVHVVSDAEILLALYRRWGIHGLRHVLGDYAFVLWDSERRELICVRDHFGVRPLYYAVFPGRLFAFASEIQALLTLEDVPADIDEDTVARHLFIPIGEDPKASYYRHVQKVLPAHVLTVSERGLEEAPYWEIDLKKETKLSSADEYAEALREVFMEAVRCRLPAHAPVASMLSGGLDSSAITSIAAGARQSSGESRVHTLSAIYPEVPESDERQYIEDVLTQIDAVPHFFAADEVDPLAEVDRINRLVGGAIRGRNLYLNWELARVASDAGARVVLDGFDGDAVVSHGEGYLNELAIAGRWWKLARVAVPFSRRRGTSPLADYRAMVRFGRRRRRARMDGFVARKPSVPPGMPIDPAFANPFADRFQGPELRGTEREIHGRHLHSPLLLEVLGWIEACGAGRGVEVRFPFFDVRVAELCVSLPPEQKLQRGWTRFVMRKAMEGIVPRGIQWRKLKTNMYKGWNHAYKRHETGRVQRLLSEPNPAVRAYLNPDRLGVLYERFLRGDTSHSEENLMWRGVSLALWLSPQEGQAPQVPGPSSSMRPRSMSSEQ